MYATLLRIMYYDATLDFFTPRSIFNGKRTDDSFLNNFCLPIHLCFLRRGRLVNSIS
jgi:hypothetical protein